MEQQRKREAADIVVDEEMEEEQHQQPPPPAADQQQNLHKAAEIQTLQKKFEELNATKSRLAKINRLMDELHQAESDVELSKQDLKETFDELTRDELTRDELTTPTQDQLTQDKDQASSIVRSSSSTTKDIVGNVLSSKAKSEFEYELNEQDKTLRNLQQEHQRLMNLKNQLFAMNEKKVESPDVAGTDNAKTSSSTDDTVVTSGHQSSPAQAQAQAQAQTQASQQQQQNQSSINNLITRSSSRLDQQTYPPDYVSRRGSVAFTDFGGPTSQQDFFGYRRASLDSTISNGNRLEEIQRHTDSIKCILTQLMKEQQQQQQFVAGSTPTPQQQQSLAVSTTAAAQQCCPHMMTSLGSRSIASTSCLCQLAPQSSTAHLMSASSLLAPLQHACSQQNLYHFDNAGQQQQQQQNFQQFQQQQQQQQLMLSFLLSCQQQMQMQQMEMRHLHQQLLSGQQQKDFNKSSSSNEEDTVGAAQHVREQQGLQYTSSFAADKQASFVVVSPTPPQRNNDNTQQMVTTNDMVKNILACIQQQFQQQQPKKCQQSQQDIQQLGHMEDTAGLRRTSITTGGPHGHSALPVAVSTPQQQARSPIHQKSSTSDHYPLIKQSTTTTKPCHSGHVISNPSKSPSSQLHKTCHSRSTEIKSMIFDEINAFLSENQQKCQQQQTEEFLLELFKELRRHSLSMTSSSGQLTIDANDQLSSIDQRSIDHMLESIKDLINRYYSNQSSRRNSSDTNQNRQPLTSKSNKYRLKNSEPPTLDKPQTFGGKSSSSEKVQTKVNSSKVNSKNDGLGNNKNQNSSTKKINESLMKKAALSTNANMDDLEEQIKLVVDDISPVLRSKAENVCNAQLSQELRQSIISSTIDKCLPLIGSSMNNTFFKRQLSSILDDTLNKFKGQKLKDCGEELLSDISDVVFNELSFFRLMQNIGNGGSGGGVRAPVNQSTENNTANGQKFDQSDSSNRKSRDEDDVTNNSLISFDSFIDWQSTLAENNNNNSKQRQNGNSNVAAEISLYGGVGIEDIVVDDNFDMVTTSFSSSTSSESISMHTAALNDSSSNLPKTLMTAITVLDNEVTSGQPMTTSGQPMTTSGQPMTTSGGQPVVTRIYESSCGQSTTTKVQPDIVGDESSDHPVRPVVTQEPQEHVVDSRGTTPPDDLLLDISDDDSLDKDIVDDEDNDNDDVDNRQRDIVGDLSPPISNSSE